MKRIPWIVPILALTALATLLIGLSMATPVAADCTTGMGTCYDDDTATCVIFDPELTRAYATGSKGRNALGRTSPALDPSTRNTRIPRIFLHTPSRTPALHNLELGGVLEGLLTRSDSPLRPPR